MPPPAIRPCQCAAETPNKLTEEIPVQHTASSFTSLDYKLFDARRILGR